MITETRIRKVYQPLNISVTTEVSGVAVTQVVNPYEGTVTPERKDEDGGRTVIRPIVDASTNESSWTNGDQASRLTEVKWLANGVDISASGTDTYDAWHKAGSALFSIASNGTISIWKNFAAEEMWTLQMRAKFLDQRTGRYYEVLTDGVDMVCRSLGDSEWDFSIVHDVNIVYSPLNDRLKLYDWLVAADRLPEGKTRADYLDATAYEVKLPIMITHGHTKVTPNDRITFRLEDHLHDHVELTDKNTLFITELTKERITIDQRFLPDETFVIDVRMYVDGEFQSQEQLTFSRYYPSVELRTTNLSDIDLDAQTRWDKCLVMFNGEKVMYPEAYLRLVWQARSSEEDEWTNQGIGEDVTINQQQLGISPTGRNELFVRIDYRIKSGLAPLSNEDGYLIENVGKIIVVDTLKE